MSTTEQDVSAGTSPTGGSRPGTCGCTSPGWAATPDAPADDRPRRGRLHLRRPRQEPISTAWPGCSSSRPGTAPGAGGGRRAQAEQLAFFPLWSYAHPKAIELAERLAACAPGDLNRVFFTTGGGEAVETAWKLAKQYFKLDRQADEAQGHQPRDRLPRHHRRARCRSPASRRSRRSSSRSCPAPSGCPTRTSTGRPSHGDDLEAFGRWAADQIEQRHRDGGARHGGGRVRRAGAELGRVLPAAARLLRAAARDLRPARRPAGLRRGHLRLRPARAPPSPARSSATSPT